MIIIQAMNKLSWTRITALISIGVLSIATSQSFVNAFVIRLRYGCSQPSFKLSTCFLSSTNNGLVPGVLPDFVSLPYLDGKRIFPTRIIFSSLKEQRIAAVFAVLNSTFSKSDEGWNVVVYVGVTQDLHSAITSLFEKYGPEKVANVRALSFSIPQPNAMQDVARQWKGMASDAGANLEDTEIEWTNTVADALSYLYDDADEYDEMIDEELEEEFLVSQMSTISKPSVESNMVISPFQTIATSVNDVAKGVEPNENDALPFTRENVDKVLNEVRPYLIADGGNVAVERVDITNGNVYLRLEGACGSCPSSTVTMKMGIERVLKEKFDSVGQVLQVNDVEERSSNDEAILAELRRLQPAISGMGASMDFVSFDSGTGVVHMKFIGSNKVKKGLELALIDLSFVSQVNFITGDD